MDGRMLRAYLAVLALGTVAMAPATSLAAQPRTAVYQAELVPDRGAGAYDGRLSLTYYANGLVSGSFRPEDGAPRPVTGAQEEDGIWLDLDLPEHIAIHLTPQGSGLTGSVWLRGELYTLTAVNVN